MWQTFPEHTKNLATNSRESYCKSLSMLAHNRMQTLCSCHVSVVMLPSFMDTCLDAEATEYGAVVWQLQPSKGSGRGEEGECRVRVSRLLDKELTLGA